MHGVRVALLHPEWASRSCADCKTWKYDADGKKATRAGVPQRRHPLDRTPCHKCPKIPASVPENERTSDRAVELTPRNAQAWRHYSECRAVLSFPDDDIVRRNAALIRGAEDEADRASLARRLALALVRKE